MAAASTQSQTRPPSPPPELRMSPTDVAGTGLRRRTDVSPPGSSPTEGKRLSPNAQQGGWHTDFLGTVRSIYTTIQRTLEGYMPVETESDRTSSTDSKSSGGSDIGVEAESTRIRDKIKELSSQLSPWLSERIEIILEPKTEENKDEIYKAYGEIILAIDSGQLDEEIDKPEFAEMFTQVLVTQAIEYPSSLITKGTLDVMNMAYFHLDNQDPRANTLLERFKTECHKTRANEVLQKRRPKMSEGFEHRIKSWQDIREGRSVFTFEGTLSGILEEAQKSTR